MAYYAPFYRPNYYDPVQQNPMGQFNQQYQQPMQQAPMQTQPTNDFLWVLGQTEAESYPVAPNNTVTLWDKNLPTIYIKSVNAQGVPSMRILDFTERASTANKTPSVPSFDSKNKFVTIDSFNALEAKFAALEGKVDELRPKTNAKTKKAEVENDG